MSRRTASVLVILITLGAVLYVRFGHGVRNRGAQDPVIQSSDSGSSPQSSAASAHLRSASTNYSDRQQPVATDAISAAPRGTPPAPTAAPRVPETAESSSLPEPTVLENMRVTIRQYASAFGENPVGTNPEITASLQGNNPKQINFLRPDGNRVNSNGELVDVWGTPYFFHQISGHEMEIRSAGPDRVMYTGDDLVTR
jgi:hypothetical protein